MTRDSMDDELLRIQRQSRRNKMIAVGIGAIPVLATCFFCTYPIAQAVIGDRFEERYPLSPEQVAEARASIERARAAARENDAAFRAALAGLTELAPRGDLGECPHRLSSEVPWEQGAFLVPPFTVHEVAPGAEASIAASAAVRRVEATAASVEEQIARPSTDPGHPSWVLGVARGAQDDVGLEVVLVVRDRRAGYGTAGPAGLAEFTSGLVRGTAYLWVPSARRFACAGQVIAENSETVEFTAHLGSAAYGTMDQSSLSHAIEQDLQVNTWRAIASSMVLAGPRMTGEEVMDALGEVMGGGSTGEPAGEPAGPPMGEAEGEPP